MVKKYQVVISGRAQRSLNRISSYIAETASDEAAIKVEKGLLEAVLNLTTLPNRHPELYIVMCQNGHIKSSILLKKVKVV